MKKMNLSHAVVINNSVHVMAHYGKKQGRHDTGPVLSNMTTYDARQVARYAHLFQYACNLGTTAVYHRLVET